MTVGAYLHAEAAIRACRPPVAHAFLDVELPKPEPVGQDVLVAVKAVAINPVDTKVRRGLRNTVDAVEDPPRVIGWDASGVVEAVGPDTTLFKPGDKVWYAGDITRSGSNAEFQLVDERIVGHMPKTLNHAEAAALPLTTITAYEAFSTGCGLTGMELTQGRAS